MFQPRNLALIWAIAGLATPLAAQRGQRTAQQWADDCDIGDRRSYAHCEVREYTVAATGALRADAHPNGSIRVYAWDRNEVKVVARVGAWGRDESEARALAEDVQVQATPGNVRSDGPEIRSGRRGWYVSYDIWAPSRTNLGLSSTNGGLTVEGIQGRLDLETTNGGIHLAAVGGDVSAETTNGHIEVDLEGSQWDGEGLRARTTNGGVQLNVPQGYNADIEASTTNGGLDFEFPVTIQGRINKRISTRLGDGGRLLSLATTNGGVSVRRR